MEAWTVVFRNLYTGFLLRDFAGKIVPGLFLLFSISSLFRSPRLLLSDFKKEAPIFVILLLGGFAWIVTLGTQSVAEGIGIWSYFPTSEKPVTPVTDVGLWRSLLTPPADKTFDEDTLKIDDFQSKASEDKKQQYERFVVIKEACGNLFAAALLSGPAWLYAWLKPRAGHITQLRRCWPTIRDLLIGVYLLLIMIGLHRMHSQHVYRQLQFAKDLVEKHKSLPESKPSSFHLDLERKLP